MNLASKPPVPVFSRPLPLPIRWGEGRGEGFVPSSAFPSFASIKNHNRAFTLLELVVVLAIIAVLTAMIVPEMRGSYEDALLRSSARKLISVFELAYSRAVSLNQIHRVRLDSISKRYFIEQRSRGGETLSGFVPLQDVSEAEGTLDPRISFQLQQPRPELPDESNPESAPAQEDDRSMPAFEEAISFYPDGTADGLEVLLRDRAGFRLRLRVNPTTARVHILETTQSAIAP